MVTSRGNFVTSFTFNGGVGENPYPIFELTLNESVIPNNDATVSETINLPLPPVSNKKLKFKESIRTDMAICELSVINTFAGSVEDTSG